MVGHGARKSQCKHHVLRPWSSFNPMSKFVECGDSSPFSEPCRDESPHSTFGGLNDDQD